MRGRHTILLLKKQVVDTLVEEVKINRNREVNVVIRLDLQKILDQDAGSENISYAAYSRRAEIYTRIHDICHSGQIRLQL